MTTNHRDYHAEAVAAAAEAILERPTGVTLDEHLVSTEHMRHIAHRLGIGFDELRVEHIVSAPDVDVTILCRPADDRSAIR